MGITMHCFPTLDITPSPLACPAQQKPLEYGTISCCRDIHANGAASWAGQRRHHFHQNIFWRYVFTNSISKQCCNGLLPPHKIPFLISTTQGPLQAETIFMVKETNFSKLKKSDILHHGNQTLCYKKNWFQQLFLNDVHEAQWPWLLLLLYLQYNPKTTFLGLSSIE